MNLVNVVPTGFNWDLWQSRDMDQSQIQDDHLESYSTPFSPEHCHFLYFWYTLGLHSQDPLTGINQSAVTLQTFMLQSVATIP